MTPDIHPLLPPFQKRPLIIGSRDSMLAVHQANQVKQWLRQQFPQLQVDIKTYKTQGDMFLHASIAELRARGEIIQGVFVKELEEALARQEIDVAIHSLKDMPGQLPEGFTLVPVGPREIPTDALIAPTHAPGLTFAQLPEGAKVGTASLRRQAVLKKLRPDLQTVTIRGNLQTRLKKLDAGEAEVLILAAAGLHRLNLQHRITYTFDPVSEMIPAAGQGILAAEYRQDDVGVAALMRPLMDPDVQRAFDVERAFLSTLGGGCHTPLACFTQPNKTTDTPLQAPTAYAMVAHPSGSPFLVTQQPVPSAAEARQVGITLAQALLAQGARQIIDSLQPVS